MSKRENKLNSDLSAKKRRKSRWEGSDKSKCFLPGMPTQLPPNLSPLEEESYLIQLQIEDISRRLRNQDYGFRNSDDRSPSPEPVYNNDGKRINTREMRARQKLEGERHKLVQRLMLIRPEYKPPIDYRVPNNREIDKVFIPQDAHPELNFVGLLIGPRGNTLKSLEKETGAKIIIRGKGSVKDGKVGSKDGLPLPGEDEPLHAYITAPIRECVNKAIKRIKEIIKEGVEIPENQNDLRKSQMKELALLNGTFREVDGINKLKAIAEAQTIVTNTIVCSVCGGVGHLPSDCIVDRQTIARQAIENNGAREQTTKMDSEYSALMEELGVDTNKTIGKLSRLIAVAPDDEGTHGQGHNINTINYSQQAYLRYPVPAPIIDVFNNPPQIYIPNPLSLATLGHIPPPPP